MNCKFNQLNFSLTETVGLFFFSKIQFKPLKIHMKTDDS
jgi:hypothetical protein